MRRLFLIIFIVIATVPCLGQSGFKTFISNTDSVNSYRAREKIFIHYDRSHYNIGDILWARGYIVAAWNHSLNDSSRLVYLEIIDSKGKTVHRSSTQCLLGQFDTSIPLKEGIYTEGTYLLRAYTRWMRNFGDSLFYQSYFKILDFKRPQWQTTIKKLSITDNRLQLQAQLKQLYTVSLSNQPVRAVIRSKRKKIAILSGYSDTEGNFAIDTLLPATLNKRDLSLELLNEDRSLLTMPLTVTSLQPGDLQFLPEGGSFVSGFSQRLGFKATDSYGKGIDVKGVIQDSKEATIASFASVYKGMGTTAFIPQTGEQYRAVLENGLKFELPKPSPTGIVLSVMDRADSLMLQVQATQEYAGQPLYLAASTRGIVYASENFDLKNGLYTLMLAKSSFPSGVVRFTIYNQQLLPVNERAVFIWHGDDMKLALSANKPEYTTRDSVELSIQIEDYNPADSLAFFSLAVIDSSQAPYSNYRENIISYLLLSSDLKGEVEDPYYYFRDPVPGAIDALMLTQGWVKYNWQHNPFSFSHEKKFTVPGRVTNLRNKGLQGINLLLKGKDKAGNDFIKYTTTGKGGRFVFKNFPPLRDSAGLAIKAFEKNPKALIKSIDAIKIDELPEYEQPEELRYVKENLALDTTVRAYINKQVQARRGKEYLEEVIVKGKIPGSHLLRPADYVYTDFETDETFSHFFFGKVFPKLPDHNLRLIGLKVMFFADGIFAGADWIPTVNPLSQVTDSVIHSVIKNSFLFFYSMKNDIKAVEVLTDRRSVMAYQNKYNWHEIIDPNAKHWADKPNFNKMKYYIVEVTTYTGKGPWMYRPNSYKDNERYYFPMVPVIAKEFYQPRYSIALKEDELPQLPATVYWKNYLMPDSNGVLKVNFYTSDSGRNLLLILQGMDANGKLGFLQETLPVKKQ